MSAGVHLDCDLRLSLICASDALDSTSLQAAASVARPRCRRRARPPRAARASKRDASLPSKTRGRSTICSDCDLYRRLAIHRPSEAASGLNNYSLVAHGRALSTALPTSRALASTKQCASKRKTSGGAPRRAAETSRRGPLREHSQRPRNATSQRRCAARRPPRGGSRDASRGPDVVAAPHANTPTAAKI